MLRCPKCGMGMIDAATYEPEGTRPLYGGIRGKDCWWVCVYGDCDDSRRNSLGSYTKEQAQEQKAYQRQQAYMKEHEHIKYDI